MSFHLTPMYHNNWSPYGSFKHDLRQMQALLDADNPSTSGSSTIEPSYSFVSDTKEASFEIELPGVRKDDISIEIQGQKLIIKGERYKKGYGGPPIEVEQEGSDGSGEKDATEVKESEPRPSLVYLLELRLGSNMDVDAVKAGNCGDGVLSVHVPMKTEKGARKIEIGA